MLSSLEQAEVNTAVASVVHSVRTPLFISLCGVEDLLEGTGLVAADLLDVKESLLKLNSALASICRWQELGKTGRFVSYEAAIDKLGAVGCEGDAAGYDRMVNIDLLAEFVDACRESVPQIAEIRLRGPLSADPPKQLPRLGLAKDLVDAKLPQSDHLLIGYCFLIAHGYGAELKREQQLGPAQLDLWSKLSPYAA